MKLQESGENYLENILILTKRLGKVRSVDLAAEMNFSKPSISRAVHLLEDEKLIVIQNDGHIDLTARGLRIAESIYERHILLTEFLMSVGVDETVAAEDACRMEHVISEQTFAKLKETLQAKGKSKPPISASQIFDSSRKVISSDNN